MDGPEVRRESLQVGEARERARLLRVDSYEVALDLRPLDHEERFSSRTTVRFACVEPGAQTFIDLSAREVTRVLLNGDDLALADVVAPTRVRLPDLASANELVVDAEFAPRGSSGGLHRAVDPSDGLIYTWTTFEPFDAHRVFACFDQPDLRASFWFTVRAPESWRVVSNSPVEDVSGDQWTFAPTPAISTYLTVVCAGPYAEWTATHRGLPIGFYCRQSLAAHLDVDVLLELTRTGLDHFAETFATPYPFAKYDHVFCPEMGGAMENVGCVTYTDQVVFRAPPSPAQRQWRRYVVLHEMAHMWFGDLVTPVWWDDLWLKESFADWAGWDALARACGDREAWADFLVSSKQGAYILDSGSTTHPVSADVDDVVSGVGRFDAISYQKGASLLKQLAALLGGKALEQGLRNYFDRHAWGNTRLTDLLADLGEQTDRDLQEWADVWVRGTGFPQLLLEIEGDAAYESVVLRQDSLTGSPTGFPCMIGIGVYDQDSAGRLMRRNRVDVYIASPETAVRDLVGRPRAAMLLVNDDDLAYARVRLDDASFDTMLGWAHTLDDPLARGLCASLAWDMVRAGELAVADQVDLAARMAPTEPSPFALEAGTTYARIAACWYVDPEQTAGLLARLGDGLLETILSQDGSAPRRRPALLGLCSVATAEEQLQEVMRIHADHSLDANLRWPALYRLVALGRAGMSEIEELQAIDPDPDAALRALAAKAALPLPDTKDEVWLHVFSHDVPATAVAEIGATFWQPDHIGLISPYAERWIAEVRKIEEADDWQSVLGRARRMAPTVGVDDGYVARLREMAASCRPTVAKMILEIADERARRLHARRAKAAPRLVGLA